GGNRGDGQQPVGAAPEKLADLPPEGAGVERPFKSAHEFSPLVGNRTARAMAGPNCIDPYGSVPGAARQPIRRSRGGHSPAAILTRILRQPTAKGRQTAGWMV